MGRPAFVISLDFELFWGVAGSQTIAGYGRNVLGEWEAIPRMLALFRRYGMRVTWATVGMLMCGDYRHWRRIRPSVPPTYSRAGLDPYLLDAVVREHPDLFFARPLVERIMDTPGQELATHTYSHFYCNEPGVTVEQLAADLACASGLGAEMKLRFRSMVFPRNQVVEPFLAALPQAGVRVYRGNHQHWLYRDGNAVAGGLAGRAVRLADACLPLSGQGIVLPQAHGRLVNLPASQFLYPWSAKYRGLMTLRLARLKAAMTAAARSGGVFHLWWHPHNFGIDLAHNLALLDAVLRHYRALAERYGMQSQCMADFDVPDAGPGRPCGLEQAAGPGASEFASPAGSLP